MNDPIVGRFADKKVGNVLIARFKVLSVFQSSSGKWKLAMEYQRRESTGASEYYVAGAIDIMDYSYVMDTFEFVKE